MAIPVSLTWYEAEMATGVGCNRQSRAIKLGLKQALNFNHDSLAAHILGACAELAVAKVLGICFSGTIGTFKEPDLPHKIEVRCRSKFWHDLPIYEKDKDDRRFVLVTGKSPNFIVHGWADGTFRKPEFWRILDPNRPAIWAIPKGRLHSIVSLMQIIHAERAKAIQNLLEGE